MPNHFNRSAAVFVYRVALICRRAGSPRPGLVVPPEALRYTFATPCQFYHIAPGLALDFFKVLTKTESERETTLILAKVKMESIPQVLLVGEDSSSSGLLRASGVGDSW